jgi:NADH-quinone oxidoreductase subunit M
VPAAEPVATGGAAVATAVRPRTTGRFLDLDRRELAVVAPLVALILVLGFYPQPLIDLIEPAVAATMQDAGVPGAAQNADNTEGTD